MYQGYRFSAIILLGGQGSRFDHSIPKQFHNIAGKKIYLHTLEVFQKLHLFDEMILVCHETFLEDVKKEVHSEKVIVIPGGSTRQASSYFGIKKASGDFVVIHDGVRPFVSEKILLENLTEVIKYKAIDTCISSTDTIVHAKDRTICDIPKREDYLRGQTPQSFDRNLILQAHENALQKNLFNVPDDCRLAQEEGALIHIVEGSEENIKITTQLDLFLAEQIFRTKKQKSEPASTDIRGKVFAVIGGSGGIGTEVCHLLEKEGAKPLSLSRSSEYPVDLTNPKSIETVFAQIFQEFGEIDGLVQCAGVLKKKSLADLLEKEIEEMISVNLTGLILCSKAAKIKPNGLMINIASSSFSRGRKETSIYSAAKAGVVNFTQGLAEELPHLRINVIVPQRTQTNMRSSNFPNEDPKTLLSPKKVAEAVLDLMKNGSLTGAILEVRK